MRRELIYLSKTRLPQALYRRCRRIFGLPSHEPEEYGQKGVDFYDRTFAEDDTWSSHYTKSPYYFCWTVVIDRLRRAQVESILEVGCGTGQLAASIRDANIITTYCGFDFSPRRVEQARNACPEFRFEIADAFNTDLFTTVPYEAAVSTEFLEHVEGDLEVLNKLRRGTFFVGTVPNFPFVSHVRHFSSADEVAQRYEPLFERFTVAPLLGNERGKTFFIVEGTKR
jgi:SAM-dependent methyltransferase